jgi:hypothetical protein
LLLVGRGDVVNESVARRTHGVAPEGDLEGRVDA